MPPANGHVDDPGPDAYLRHPTLTPGVRRPCRHESRRSRVLHVPGGRRVAIEDAAAMGANVNSPVELRVTGNLQDQSPLMLIIVNSCPCARLVG